MAEGAKSGKRVVVIMLALALGVSLIGWFAASRVEQRSKVGEAAAGEAQPATVLSDGVMFEATAGDPGLVIAKEVGSGKELWRAELGTVTAQPSLTVNEELIEVDIAGTPWMTLDRESGQPVD